MSQLKDSIGKVVTLACPNGQEFQGTFKGIDGYCNCVLENVTETNPYKLNYETKHYASTLLNYGSLSMIILPQ